MATCANCETQIGLMRKMTGGGLSENCERVAKKAKSSAHSEYETLLTQIASGEVNPADMTDRIAQLERTAEFKGSRLAQLRD